MFKYILPLLLLAGCSNRSLEATVTAQNGLNGSGCSAVPMIGGTLIQCSDGSSSVILNGAAGQDGLNGTNGTNGQNGAAGTNGTTGADAILEVVNPCGVEFANDEVFLRLSSGRLLALYDGGPHQDRLVLLAPGNYITTDSNQNAACSFTVTNTYQIINEVRN
jgi:hypothetical protein